MITIDNTMTASDQILATLTMNGKVMATLSSDGFQSFDEVVRAIRSAAGHLMGLCNVSVRNRTQGWSRSLMVSRVAHPSRRA